LPWSTKTLDFDEGTDVKIHEYQGKEILKKFGVAVPRGADQDPEAHTLEPMLVIAERAALPPTISL